MRQVGELACFEDLGPVNDEPIILSEEDPPDRAIIMDNGSYSCKVGWNFSDAPTFNFRNVTTKNVKSKKANDILVGNMIFNIEFFRLTLRSPFDAGLLVNCDVQEQILDHALYLLGVSEDEVLAHTVVITEPIGNPTGCRMQLLHLLFEVYRAPSVLFVSDALSSLYHNSGDDIPQDCLLINLGHVSSHVLPILAGEALLNRCSRVNVGSSHVSALLQKLLHLRYPNLHLTVSISRCEELVSKHCYFSPSYRDELDKFKEDLLTNRFNIFLPQIKELDPLSEAEIDSFWREKRDKYAVKLHEFNVDRLRLAEAKLNVDITTDSPLDTNKVLIWKYWHEQAINPLPATPQKLLKAINEATARLNPVELKNTLVAARRAKEAKESSISKLAIDYPDWLQGLRLRREYFAECEAAPRRVRDFEKQDVTELDVILKEFDALLNTNFLNYVESFCMHLDEERFRAPECFFQPHLVGVNQAGLAEVMENVLKNFSPEEQARLASNVFVTGGGATIAGIEQRLRAELTQLRPFGSDIEVRVAADPVEDAWRGASGITHTANWRSYAVTLEDYETRTNLDKWNPLLPIWK